MYASTSTDREKWITRSYYRTSRKPTGVLRAWLCSTPGTGNSNRPNRKHTLCPGARCCTIDSAICREPFRASRSDISELIEGLHKENWISQIHESTVAQMRRHFRLPGTPRSSIRVIVDRLLNVAACRVAGLRTLEHIQEIFCHAIRGALLLVIVVGLVAAESNSRLTGRVVDPSDRAVPRAQIVVRNLATLLEHSAITNSEGIYEIRALPVGTYRLQVKEAGFRSYTVERLNADVARTITQDVRLEIGDVSQEITVKSQEAPIDRATISVGHLIDGRTVQQLQSTRFFLCVATITR